MVVNLKIRGIPTVIARLNNVSKEVKQAVNVALQEFGPLVKEEVEASIDGLRAESRSVATGAFLESIQFQIVNNAVKIFSEVPYAKYLEYGTTRMPEGRRHFLNSFGRIRPELNKTIKELIHQAVK
mgnify:CR=1 FL=1